MCSDDDTRSKLDQYDEHDSNESTQ